MRLLTRTGIEDARGVARIAIGATEGVADIVESMHRTIQRVPGPIGRGIDERTRGITGFVYRTVRGTIGLVGTVLDLGLSQVSARLPQTPSGAGRETWLSRVNGLWGDHLAGTDNPLAITMRLRHNGADIDTGAPVRLAAAGQAASSRLLVLVHGLCLSDHDWCRDGHDHGRLLAEERGYAPLYARYNSGLRISDNGRLLAAQLEGLVRHWPQPIDQISFIGHSMGGLVIRSAVHQGREAGHRWADRVGRIVFLATPHLGTPLERAGQWVDTALGFSPYSAPLARIGKVRSAGIGDLRHGTVLDDGRDVMLPEGVACYAIAGRLRSRSTRLDDALIGDGLVPVDSALGRHRQRPLGIPESRQWVGDGMGHFDLLSRPEVCSRLRQWL